MTGESLNEYLIRIRLETLGAEKAFRIQEQVNAALNQLKLSSKKFGKVVDSNSTIIRTDKGNMIKWNAIVKNSNDIIKTTGSTYSKVSGVFSESGKKIVGNSAKVQALGKDFQVTGKKAGGFEQDIMRLAKRAMLTIPIWYALRQVINSVLSSFRMGVESIKNLDIELQRLSLTLGDTANKQQILTQVQEKAIKLSRETGKSVNEIVRAFYQFKTIGMDVETSMAGMEVSTRGSIAMMADLVPLSQILARSYSLLGKTMDSNVSIQNNLQASIGKILYLYEENDFVLNQLGESLDTVISSANSMNLTFDETITYLASLHTGVLQSSKAGRLLRTSLLQVMSNLDKVGGILKIHVNPNLHSTGEIFSKILHRLKALQREGNLEKVGESLKDIFSGIRGGQVGQTLLAVFGTWEKNVKMIKEMGTEKFVERFYSAYGEGLDRFNVQMDRLKNLQRELGRGFIINLVGGDDIADSLKNINEFLETTIKNLSKFARMLRYIHGLWSILFLKPEEEEKDLPGKGTMFEGLLTEEGKFRGVDFSGLKEGKKKLIKITEEYDKDMKKISRGYEEKLLDQIESAFSGAMSPENIQDLIGRLQEVEFKAYFGFDKERIIENLKEIQKEIEEEPSIRMKLVKSSDSKFKSEDVGLGSLPPIEISPEVERRLKLLKEELKYTQMRIEGYNEIEISQEKALDLIQGYLDIVNEIEFDEKSVRSIMTSKEILLAAQEGRYTDIKKALEGIEDSEKAVELIQQKSTELQKARLEHYLEYVEKVRSEIKGAMYDLFSRETDLSGVFSSLGEKFGEMFRQGVSDSISRELFKLTGIDKLFGNLFTQIEFSHFNGMMRGIKELEAAWGRINASNVATNTVGGYGDLTRLRSAGVGTEEPYGVTRFASETPGYTGIPSTTDKPGLSPSQLRNIERREKIQSAKNTVALLSSSYMGYQAAGGGLGGIVSGLGGLGMGIGTLQAGATAGLFATGLLSSALIPGIGLALAAAGMLIPSKSKSTQVSEQTREAQVAPKIDITNKNLEIINRNLVALRTDMRTFVLPQSAYWSTKNNLADEFSLHARMGLLN
jgi:TP901 family phage tail tape measure protein